MPRKAVTRRLDLIRQLQTFLRAAGPTLDRRLTRRPAAPDDPGLSYRPLFDHFQAELAAVERRLTDAEDAYDRDQANTSQLRKERAQAAHALHGLQSSTQRLLRGLLGDQALKGLGISGAPPRDVAALRQQVRWTIPVLHNPNITASHSMPELEVDSAALAARLQTDLASLEAAHRRLEAASAGLTGARCRADGAVAEVDRVAPWIARTLENLCGLAGEHRLAGRVRGR